MNRRQTRGPGRPPRRRAAPRSAVAAGEVAVPGAFGQAWQAVQAAARRKTNQERGPFCARAGCGGRVAYRGAHRDRRVGDQWWHLACWEAEYPPMPEQRRGRALPCRLCGKTLGAEQTAAGVTAHVGCVAAEEKRERERDREKTRARHAAMYVELVTEPTDPYLNGDSDDDDS